MRRFLPCFKKPVAADGVISNEAVAKVENKEWIIQNLEQLKSITQERDQIHILTNKIHILDLEI